MDDSGNILRRIRMFVTDADGTLMGGRPEFDKYRAFRAKINDLRSSYGAIWVVCTGRSLGGYKKIFRPMNAFGIRPDYVIACHAYIYECKRWGFLPHWTWNLQVLWLQWCDQWALRRAMPRLRRAVLSRNPFARVAYSGRERLCFRFEDEAAADFAFDILQAEARPYKYLRIFRSPGDVEVRVIPFTKGLAVSELARHLGVANSQILVVGDGHNDISMMEMEPPCHTACPGNAAAEVIEAVHKTGGHIATHRSLGGVLEVLTAYESGQINPQLPEGWSGADHASSVPRPSHGIRGMGAFLLLALVVYTTLLVVCTFCRFPGRDWLMSPYVTVVENIRLIMSHFGK